MSDSSGGPAPGWYPDIHGTQRWWDGTAWTEQTRSDGPAAGAVQPGEPTRVRQAPLGEDGRPVDPPAYPPAGAPGGPGAPPAYAPPGQPAWANVPGAPMPPMPPTQSGPGGPGKSRTVLFAALGGGLVLLIVVVVVLALTLGGDDGDQDAGGAGPATAAGGATATAEAFAQAVADQDYSGACELTTSDARDEILGQADVEACSDLTTDVIGGQDLTELTEDLDVTADVDDVQEDGDTATADITITTTYTGDDPQLAEGLASVPPTDLTIELVVEDGEWLVSDAS